MVKKKSEAKLNIKMGRFDIPKVVIGGPSFRIDRNLKGDFEIINGPSIKG